MWFHALRLKVVILEMPKFWEGEMKIARIPFPPGEHLHENDLA